MPTPAFGFSVGDVISAINLINQVRKSLKDVGGAASEYQSAVIELENLAATLSHLEALEVDDDNAQHVNAIRAMALACKFPLEEFRKKLMRYETVLGPFAQGNWARATGKKMKWSVKFGQEVEKLRAVVVAKHVSISLLLEMQISKSLSKGNAEMRGGFQTLEEKVAEHRVILCSLEERTERIEDRVKLAHESNQQTLESIETHVDKVNRSVIRIGNIGQHMMDHLADFSATIRALFGSLIQSNLQIYQLLLQIQKAMPARPTNLLETKMRFEGPLGEIRELPYEYFHHWEIFKAFLGTHFTHKPGKAKVHSCDYHLIDNARIGAVVNKEDWSRRVHGGATISMSIIMSDVRMRSGKCLRRDCKGEVYHVDGTYNQLYCKICCLRFSRSEMSVLYLAELCCVRLTVF